MLQQICVIEVHGNPRYPDAPAIPLTVLINPVVTALTGETEDKLGGLGVGARHARGIVPRATSVRLEALLLFLYWLSFVSRRSCGNR